MSATTGYVTPKKAGYDIVQTPRFSNEYMQQMQTLRGQIEPGATSALQGMNKMAAGGDEDYWKQLEAPAMRQFAELQGNTASRFSGMGSGARRSSGFQNEMGGAASGLAQQLQSNRLGLQKNAQDQLLQMYMQLMGKDPYEISLMEKKKKGLNWGNMMSGAGKGAAAGSVFGPWGAAAGGIAGGSFGLFSNE